MGKYAIVAIGYNRADSMQRLLKSLSKVEYDGDDVSLIISIDNSGTDFVEKCADKFVWDFGEKIVKTYPERLGLRNHILSCGNFLKDYDAIAVFEDDIVAAPGFYTYMKETVAKYESDDRIAGISLYNHLWNVNVKLPFQPQLSPYDVYFLQFAQSWGQIWMKNQWFEFVDWYNSNSEEFTSQENIPDFVSGWPKTSWLKYHIKYCIEKNKFFVYPYTAFSTCFSDVGEHCSEKNTCLQVPMMQGVKKGFVLPDLDDEFVIKYDSFFERIMKDDINGINPEEYCMDLYGSRKGYLGKRYVVTKKSLPYKAIKSFSLDLKPHEENISQAVLGEELFLYDLMEAAEAPKTELVEFLYYFRLYGRSRELGRYVLNRMLQKLRRKIYKK